MLHTADRKLLIVVDDPADGNTVVYDADTMEVLFNRQAWDRPTAPPPHAAPSPHSHPAPHDPPAHHQPLSGGGQPIRVTDERDGELLNRMYSYWSNAVVIGGDVWIFAGHAGGQPRFFRVNMANGHVERPGPLLPYIGTGEGWSWSLDGWIYLLEGPRLHSVHPFSGEDRVIFDIEGSHPGCILWQAHSSDDGSTHSATVKRVVSDGAYPAIGTVVVRHGRQTFFDRQGDLDESIISRDGRHLLIQESHNNRIINLDTRETRLIRDGERAVAHCDTGPSYVIGEADKPDPGACVLWDFDRLNEGPRILFHTLNMGHVSVRGGRCLLSTETSLGMVALDGSGVAHLTDHGMQGSGYDYQVHANLSPCGRVACWVSNAAGRFDVYVMAL